jgi:hypothetical protein
MFQVGMIYFHQQKMNFTCIYSVFEPMNLLQTEKTTEITFLNVLFFNIVLIN